MKTPTKQSAKRKNILHFFSGLKSFWKKHFDIGKLHIFILFYTAICFLPILSFAQFTSIWTQTVNPSGGTDYVYAIKADASGIYVAGYDNGQWRMEKRGLTTGMLIPTFGTAGVVVSNPSGGQDAPYAITADTSGIYVAGSDNIPGGGNFQLRIEKRTLTTGALIWTQTNDPSNNWDWIQGITADTSGIYVAGFDGSQGGIDEEWYIEKRNLNTGTLIPAFGTAGVITNNPSFSDDRALAITVDASGIYVAGRDKDPGNSQWHIEKRDLTTGVLDGVFGGGTGVVTSNPSIGDDWAYSIAVDASGIYVAGFDNSPGNTEWRVEKRDLTTGALINTFGTAGVVTGNSNPGLNEAWAITADASGIYVAGYDNSSGNNQFRIEKRDLGTGLLLCTQTSNPSINNDYALAITADASGIYVGGADEILGAGNPEWRIEKYDLCSSILSANIISGNINCKGQCTGTATANPVNGTSPITYLWSNSQTTPTITGLCAGTYTVIITDADTTATAAVTITQPIAPLAAGISSFANATCNALCNGKATATASGGTPGYTYSWNSTPVQISSTASGLCAGNYTVTITDSKGCTTTQTVTINQPTALVASIAAPTNVTCKGFCNGSATVNASGGTPGYTFLWNLVSGGQTTSTPTDLCAGVDTVTVTDANGCSMRDTVTITILYATPTAYFTYQPQPATIVNSTIQFMDNSQYNIFSWLWSFGDFVNGSSSLQNPNYTYSDTGTYIIQLIVTDNHGCKDTTHHTIFINADYIFYAPNSFTPNNDGINDIFIPQTEIIISIDYSLIIFDRWGNKVFETKDYKKGWDGKVKNTNTIAQEDVYIWMVKLYDFNRQQHNYTGKVNVLRQKYLKDENN